MLSRKYSLVIFNIISSLILIWGAISIYLLNPFYLKFLKEETYFILITIAILYSLFSAFSALYYASKCELSKSSCLFFIIYKYIKKEHLEITYQAQTKLLFILVKFIFIPVMINFSVINFLAIISNYYGLCLV